MKTKTDALLNDTRIIKRNLKKGWLTEAEHASFVDALPDAAESATAFTVTFEPSKKRSGSAD